jgi:anti-anti-sigma factor
LSRIVDAVDMRTMDSTIGGRPTLSVEGIIDLASLGDLHDALTRTIRKHSGAVVIVDLDAVVGIDDCALGLLLGAAATARESAGDLELVCNSEAVRNRFERTRLDRAITIRSTIS